MCVFFRAQEYDNSLTFKKNLLFFYKTTVNHWAGKVMLAPVLGHQTENFMHLSQLQGQIL